MKQADHFSTLTSLRQKVEELLYNLPRKRIPHFSQEEIIKLLHELEVSQIELSLQNEELIESRSISDAVAQKYADLYDFAPTGYCTLSRDGEIIEMNFALAAMLGRERPHLTDSHFGFFVSSISRPVFTLFLTKAFDSKTKESCDISLVINGIPKYVSLTGQSDGEQCLVTMVDTTEHTLAVAELQINEERFRNIFENSIVGKSITFVDGKMKVNEAFRQLLGYSEAEFANFKWQEITCPDDLESDQKIVTMLLSGEKMSMRWEKRYLHKNGKMIWVDISTTLERDSENRPAFFNTLVIDITKRKEAEQQLNESLMLLRIAEKTAKIGGWSFDLQQGRVTWSDEVAAIHEMPAGYSPQVGEGISFYAPEYYQKISTAFENCATNGTPFNEELQIITPRGNHVWAQLIGEAIRDEKGNIVKIHGAFQDINERKQSEAVTKVRSAILEYSFYSDLTQLLQKTLDEIEQLTGSKIAFFHFLEADQKTLSLQTWSTNTLQKMCTTEGAGTHYNVDQAGVWVECIHTGAAVIHNDYESLPNRKGLPDGHAFVIRELVVPIVRNKKIVAILGVGNKESIYNQTDILQVTEIADLAWDITERKRTEEKLNRSEEKFRTFSDFAYDWEYWEAKDGQIIYTSPSCERISGYPPEEFLSDSELLKKITHQDDLTAYENHLGKLHSDTYMYAIEQHNFRIVKKDGSIAHIGHLCRPVFDEKGNYRGRRISNRDITEHVNAIEAIRTMSERLKNLHLLDVAILQAIESPKEIIQTALHQIRGLLRCNYTGVSLFDMGKRTAKVFAEDDQNNMVRNAKELRTDILAKSMELLEKEKIEILEDISPTVAPSPLNQIFNSFGIMSALNVALYSELGLTGVLNIGWETPRSFSPEELEIALEVGGQISIALKQTHLLNETKRYASQLEGHVSQRTAQLEAANRELEAFSYSVSHDLRAPLRHISGYIDLLINHFTGKLSEKEQHYLDNIADSAHQMGLLIDNLLHFSRTGRQEMQPIELDMNLVLRQALETVEPDIKGRNIEWKIGNLPTVHGDHALLQLVWINLIGNAIKFTGPIVDTRIEIGVKEQHQEYLFFVCDNGVGFDMKYSAKLFGVFQRLHSAQEFDGTGIGLANVRRIILRHGGRTWAEAQLNKGATFYFTLPKKGESSYE
jgi:PAS domain S-box-containing protein